MIYIIICLLFVSALDCRIVRQQRAASCSWIGHCVGDPCSNYNDCDGSLICQNNKCSDGGSNSSGNHGQDGTCVSSGVLHGTM